MSCVKFLVKHKDVGFKFRPIPANNCFYQAATIPGLKVKVFLDASVEQYLVTNPRNRCQIVVCWIQTRPGMEIGTSHSEDGGKSWTQTFVPYNVCFGGVSQLASDPWLTYSADGKKLFLISLVRNNQVAEGTNIQSGLAVATSTDNGATWNRPQFIETSCLNALFDNPACPIVDKESITADVNDSRYVYATWSKYPNADTYHGDAYFTRSTDNGVSWETPRLIYNGTTQLCQQNLSNCAYNDNQTLGDVISNASKNKKRLLHFFTRLYATPDAKGDDYINDFFPYKFTRFDYAVQVSNDRGVTWESNAISLLPTEQFQGVYTGGYTYKNGKVTGSVGVEIRVNPLIAMAIDQHRGIIYAVFLSYTYRRDFLPVILLTASYDDGRTWSAPVKVNQTPENSINPQAYTPAIAVNSDGIIAITYSDLRFDTKSDPKARTLSDTWVVLYENLNHCREHTELKLIEEVRLSPQSYIVQNGPTTGIGYMVNADYQQIAANGKRFYSVHTETLDGPFDQPSKVTVNPGTDQEGTLLINKSKRTKPYVDVFKVSKKH